MREIVSVYIYYPGNVGGKYICFQTKPKLHIISYTQKPRDRYFAKKLKEELDILVTYPEADISMYTKAAYTFLDARNGVIFTNMSPGEETSLTFLPNGYDYFIHHIRFHIRRISFVEWRMTL